VSLIRNAVVAHGSSSEKDDRWAGRQAEEGGDSGGNKPSRVPVGLWGLHAPERSGQQLRAERSGQQLRALGPPCAWKIRAAAQGFGASMCPAVLHTVVAWLQQQWGYAGEDGMASYTHGAASAAGGCPMRGGAHPWRACACAWRHRL